ncbi:MAG: hypothetical protein JW895_14490 [Thermoleophilaceae bacterium]|nr:hypothetical protein [Thermoleophilaceae bacterium]
MSRYDWLLFLHLIGAFASVGSAVVFSVLLASGARVAAPELTFLGRRLWDVGGTLTLVFGVWLALDLDSYGIFDGWILGAFVLWAIAGGVGIQLGLAFASDEPPAQSRVRTLYAAMTVSVLALLVIMIYKPGA